MFIYLFLRESESTSRGGAERERGTQNPKQSPDSNSQIMRSKLDA